MNELRTEVLIAGAGPAGATAALNLAPFRSVLLIDPVIEPVRRPGESLVPAARRLLTDMGLIGAFEALGFPAYHGNGSVWGSETFVDSGFLRDLDGPGWHIDRVCFEKLLRDAAVQRGAQVVAPGTIESIERCEDKGFAALLRVSGNRVSVRADFVIDAGGRRAKTARLLGAVRHDDHALMCRSIYGRDGDGATGWGNGITFIEAVEGGWWYTSPLPRNQRVLAFHTDSDLKPELDAPRTVRAILDAGGFETETRWSGCVAGGSVLAPCCGPGWLAAGDAALTFDPLSSQGLFNALFMGLMAAETAHSYLSGRHAAIDEYRSSVQQIRQAYVARLDAAYRLETRWPDAAFWARRHASRIHWK